MPLATARNTVLTLVMTPKGVMWRGGKFLRLQGINRVNEEALCPGVIWR